jgi:hypothetical protein
MPNGWCKLHGGKSTGPRTREGLERSRRANWKHGYYSREAKAERSRVRAAILALRYLRILGLRLNKLRQYLSQLRTSGGTFALASWS